jgi:hypothetical protein
MIRTLATTLIAAALGLVFAVEAAAQSLPLVRITAEEGAVYPRRSVKGQPPIAVSPAGTLLEALDKVDSWYWVLLPPDAYGTRVAGWMQVGDAELAGPLQPGTAVRALTGEVLAVETALKGPQIRKSRSDADAEAAARLRRAERALEDARQEYEELTKEAPEAPPPC